MTGCCVIFITFLTTFNFATSENRRPSYNQNFIGIGRFPDDQAFIGKASHDRIHIEDHFPIIGNDQCNTSKDAFDGQFRLSFLEYSVGKVNLSSSEDITDLPSPEYLVDHPV